MAELLLKSSTTKKRDGEGKFYYAYDVIEVFDDCKDSNRRVTDMWLIIQVEDKKVSELNYLKEELKKPLEVQKAVDRAAWENCADLDSMSHVVGEQLTEIPSISSEALNKVVVTYVAKRMVSKRRYRIDVDSFETETRESFLRDRIIKIAWKDLQPFLKDKEID